LSSVCDPYQPLERKYQLTRGIIKLILPYSKFAVSILTKNALVLRDLDLLERMKSRLDVGFTITTFDDSAQRIFEPLASSVQDRIEALRTLNSKGIDTWVFIAPMLPYVTEENLQQGLNQLAKAGVKRLSTDRFNARGMIITRTLQAYKQWRPDLNIEEVRALLWGGDQYYRQLDAKIDDLWKKVSLGASHDTVF